MKLTYRGISYQSSQTIVSSTTSETFAKFRGQSYQISGPFICPLNCSNAAK